MSILLLSGRSDVRIVSWVPEEKPEGPVRTGLPAFCVSPGPGPRGALKQWREVERMSVSLWLLRVVSSIGPVDKDKMWAEK